MPPSDRFGQSEDVIAQKSEDQLVLFHLVSGGHYSLNELGARIWDLCETPCSVEEVAGIIAQEYDAPHEVIVEDTRKLVADLVENQLLVLQREASADTP